MSAVVAIWLALAVAALWGIAVIVGSGRFTKGSPEEEVSDWLTAFTWESRDEETIAAILARFTAHAIALRGAERVISLYVDRSQTLSTDTLPTSSLGAETITYLSGTKGVSYRDAIATSTVQLSQGIDKAFDEAGVEVIVSVTRNEQLLVAVGIDFGGQASELELEEDLKLTQLVLSRACANVTLHAKALDLHSFVESEAKARELTLCMVPEDRSGEEGTFRWRGHFAHAYDPASEFWGVYPLEHGRVLVIMGEAKKETLAGAMIAAVVKSCCDQILRELPIAPGPKALLEMLNSSLFRVNGEARSSCVAIILDPSRSSLSYACAGHSSPYRLRRDSKSMEVIALNKQGPVLGETASPAYEQHEVSLETADTLVVVSSGLLSPQNRDAEAFGAERLVKHLTKQTTTDVEWLMDEILSAITLHSFDESLREGQALLVIGPI